MVAYTMFSLTLIAQPLVRENTGPAKVAAAPAGPPATVADGNRYR
jgi:hypothetical protein